MRLKNGTRAQIFNTNSELDGHTVKIRGIYSYFAGGGNVDTLFYIIEFENDYLYNDYSCIVLINHCIKEIKE